MSMLASIVRITADDVAALSNDPACVGDLLNRQVGETAKPGWLARLFGKPAPPPAPRRKRPPVDQCDIYDVDRQWHVLHYLLTGSAWDENLPGAFLAGGGQPVGPDLGYGPARLFQSAEVCALNAWLEQFSFETFAQRYDPELMTAAKIYWRSATTAEEWKADIDGLWASVTEIRAFLQETALRRGAILVDIY